MSKRGSKTPSQPTQIGVMYERNHSVWYVADLPGHDGTKRNPTTPRSDWGYTQKIEKAIHITPYWARRYRKYLRDTNRAGRVMERGGSHV